MQHPMMQHAPVAPMHPGQQPMPFAHPMTQSPQGGLGSMMPHPAAPNFNVPGNIMPGGPGGMPMGHPIAPPGAGAGHDLSSLLNMGQIGQLNQPGGLPPNTFQDFDPRAQLGQPGAVPPHPSAAPQPPMAQPPGGLGAAQQMMQPMPIGRPTAPPGASAAGASGGWGPGGGLAGQTSQLTGAAPAASLFA
jgi:hypothetical protein